MPGKNKDARPPDEPVDPEGIRESERYARELEQRMHDRTLELDRANRLMAREIEDRRRAEAALVESEERYRLLVEMSPDTIYVHSGGVIVYANPAAVRMLGATSLSEIRGMPIMDIVHPDYRPVVAQRVQQMLVDGTSAPPLEERFVRLDGTTLCGEAVAMPLLYEGKPAVQVVIRDLTERKQAEDELRASEERFRNLFEASPVSLWLEDLSEVREFVDDLVVSGCEDLRAHFREHPEDLIVIARAMRVLDVNTVTLKMYGAETKEQLLGGLDRVMTPGSIEMLAEVACAVAERRSGFEIESTNLDLNGNPLDIVLDWSVVPGHEDDFAAVLVSVRDVTDRHRIEQELKLYRDELEQRVAERTAELLRVNADLAEATRAKSDFLASMSHELRTPLNSIIGFTGVMLQGMAGEIGTEQRKQLEMVQRSGKQLLSLVNDVLDLSRIEAGRAGVEASSFEVAPFLRSLVDMVRPMADENALPMEADLSHAPRMMVSDKDKVGQILLNLLTNAIKFTEEGSVGLTVREDGDHVVFTVTDTGVGIAAEDQEDIFNEFHQLTSPKLAKIPGTGLGLAICRKLCDLLGGTIDVESRVGVGSTFTVRLPMVTLE